MIHRKLLRLSTEEITSLIIALETQIHVLYGIKSISASGSQLVDVSIQKYTDLKVKCSKVLTNKDEKANNI